MGPTGHVNRRMIRTRQDVLNGPVVDRSDEDADKDYQEDNVVKPAGTEMVTTLCPMLGLNSSTTAREKSPPTSGH